MKNNDENKSTVRHEEIARLARQIWEQEGRQSGSDLDHWLKAERQLLSKKSQTSNGPLNSEAKTGSPLIAVRTLARRVAARI